MGCKTVGRAGCADHHRRSHATCAVPNKVFDYSTTYYDARETPSAASRLTIGPKQSGNASSTGLVSQAFNQGSPVSSASPDNLCLLIGTLTIKAAARLSWASLDCVQGRYFW